jgi:hypothetical protein
MLLEESAENPLDRTKAMLVPALQPSIFVKLCRGIDTLACMTLTIDPAALATFDKNTADSRSN